MRFKDTLGISYYVRKMDLVLTQALDAALQSMGLSLAKYSVLSILEEEKNLTNAELARRASVTPQTMNRLTHSLEEEGFLETRSDKNHSLKIQYALTSKAVKLLCDAHIVIHDLELKTVKGLNKKEIEAFKQFLKEGEENLRLE